MDRYSINGIQQVGIGTVDFRRSWRWFIDHFGFDIRILEDDTVAERMLPYTGGQAQKRHACIAANLNGGGALEIWQYSERAPKEPTKPAEIGDLGIWAAKVRCRDVEAFRRQIDEEGIVSTAITMTPDKVKCFYLRDLYGNLFQIVESSETFIEQKKLCGGIAGACIGVSDMERSLEFYRDILGYDTIVYDFTCVHKDWEEIISGKQTYRRVLLKSSKASSGAFSGLYGSNSIELVQALERKPTRIYEGRYWGDPGFIQVCYDVVGMDAFGRFCAEKGHPFTVDSCPGGEVFDMGDASGRFTYVEDPDGTLLEFVETYKIPVAKKLGWFIDLRGRGRQKPLPKFLFRVMGLISRVKL